MKLLKILRISVSAGMLTIGVVVPSFAQHKKSPNKELIKNDTSVVIGKLPNGLTYYIRPNAKPEKKVELRLVVKAGSLQEDDDQQGLAHFTEHMEFNGLKHFPKNEMIDYLQKIGVRFGADLNASTGWDRTAYELPIPTDDPENLPKAFQILRDWADGALMTTKDINEERKVILEELRMSMRNADFRLISKELPGITNGSRYASRMSGGKDEIVANGNPNLIRRFYADWYRPDLMAVIVVGDITVLQAKSLIAKYFTPLRNPLKERQRLFYGVKPYAAKKAMVLTDPEAVGYSFSLYYPAEASTLPKTITEYRQGLVNRIVFQCLSRRLRDRGESANPPYTSAGLSPGGDIAALTLHSKAMELSVTPVDNFTIAIDAAVQEVLSASKFGFTDAEVKRAGKSILSSYENGYHQRTNTMSSEFAEGYIDIFTKGQTPVGIVNHYNYVEKLLPGITVAEINSAVAKLKQAPTNYFAMINGPTNGKIKMPSNQELLNVVDAAFRQVPSKENTVSGDSTILTVSPVPGKILSETKDSDLGATTFKLSNGVLVTIKETNLQKDQILFAGIKNGGSNNYGPEDKYNLLFLNNLTEVMGAGNFTPSALSDLLSNKQVAVGVEMTNISNTIEGSSNSADFENMLQLAHLKLTQPRKDPDLYKGWLTKVTNFIPQLKADPANLYQDSLTKVLYHGNALAPIVIPSVEAINGINVDRVIEIYKKEFGHADGYHFFLVGNLDQEKIRPLIEKYLGSLPTNGSTPTFSDNGLRAVTGDHFFKFYGGQENKATLSEMFHGETPYSSDQNLKATMLAHAMTIEIIDTVREKMQAIYSGSASASMQKEPNSYFTFSIQMPCGPENVNAIFQELDKEVKRYRTVGVSEVNLEKVKKEMCERYRESLEQNSTWLSELEIALFWKREKSDFFNFQQRVNSITGQSLKETANLIFSGNKFRAVWYPAEYKNK